MIERLKIKRAELDKRMKANLEWAEMYDREIGPFQMTYGKNTEGIAVIYDNAKKFHGKGIQMLVDEFDYHPAFKRPTDTFSATPFQPKWLLSQRRPLECTSAGAGIDTRARCPWFQPADWTQPIRS